MLKQKNLRIAFAGALAVGLLGACSDNDETRNRVPQIAGLQDQSVAQDTVLGPLNFQVRDLDSGPEQITVTAQSSDKVVIPNEGITLAGSGGDRTIQVTPTAEAIGASTITLTAVDPTGRQSTSAFRVQVNGVFVSFKGRTGEVYAQDEKDAPQSLSGFTFTLDAEDDPAAFDALLQ